MKQHVHVPHIVTVDPSFGLAGLKVAYRVIEYDRAKVQDLKQQWKGRQLKAAMRIANTTEGRVK